MDNDLNKKIDDRIKTFMSGGAFTVHQVADTPSDAYAVVSRNYVNLNGVTGSRPTSPVTGQYFFDTTLGYAIWYNGSVWVNYNGTPV